ncbi:hypothetical protein AVEN_86542-1 [Araneus ventricosus]|uniref:Uncharacterized protein n=1 Tax=Araneus ventricosus TaxID=182803 RepID=A0A4Y2FWD1_ARAVE|nr:hypothetical protein AVEN_86542-1 [Araneus ventricosus]
MSVRLQVHTSSEHNVQWSDDGKTFIYLSRLFRLSGCGSRPNSGHVVFHLPSTPHLSTSFLVQSVTHFFKGNHSLPFGYRKNLNFLRCDTRSGFLIRKGKENRHLVSERESMCECLLI